LRPGGGDTLPAAVRVVTERERRVGRVRCAPRCCGPECCGCVKGLLRAKERKRYAPACSRRGTSVGILPRSDV